MDRKPPAQEDGERASDTTNAKIFPPKEKYEVAGVVRRIRVDLQAYFALDDSLDRRCVKRGIKERVVVYFVCHCEGFERTRNVEFNKKKVWELFCIFCH